MLLHQFLFDHLHAHGVRHIFGIPGDFVLNLYNALEEDGRFQLVTFSHEPAVGFAADGAARISNGLGVCLVTYGAGGLNMINSVACAYAEESPLVLIVGVEVHRFQLTGAVVALAERLKIPVISSFLGRGIFPTHHPQFIGTYLGAVSPPAMRQVVEQSDCLLMLGERLSDVSLGVSADLLRDRELITVVARDVFIKPNRYEHTSLERVVERLLAAPGLPAAADPISAI